MDDLAAMTTKEVAARLGVTRSAVARMARTGALHPLAKLPGGRGLYLFSPDEVEALREIRNNHGRKKPGPKPRGGEG